LIESCRSTAPGAQQPTQSSLEKLLISHIKKTNITRTAGGAKGKGKITAIAKLSGNSLAGDVYLLNLVKKQHVIYQI